MPKKETTSFKKGLAQSCHCLYVSQVYYNCIILASGQLQDSQLITYEVLNIHRPCRIPYAGKHGPWRAWLVALSLHSDKIASPPPHFAVQSHAAVAIFSPPLAAFNSMRLERIATVYNTGLSLITSFPTIANMGRGGKRVCSPRPEIFVSEDFVKLTVTIGTQRRRSRRRQRRRP